MGCPFLKGRIYEDPVLFCRMLQICWECILRFHQDVLMSYFNFYQFCFSLLSLTYLHNCIYPHITNIPDYGLALKCKNRLLCSLGFFFFFNPFLANVSLFLFCGTYDENHCMPICQRHISQSLHR